MSVQWLGMYVTAPASPTLNQAYYNSTDGKSYVFDGTSWQMMTQDGVQGIPGSDGTNGVDGKTILNGTINPTSEGVDGDFYLNTTTSTIYGPKTAGVWGTGTSLVGTQGMQGIQGPSGTGLTNRGNWLSGTTYTNGDYVFDRSTGNPAVNSMWICQTSSFTSTVQPYTDATHWVEFQAPAGPQGAAGTNGTNGYSVLSGTIVPTTQGVNGDFYINTSTNLIYGPKTAGIWGSGTSLIGPQGAAGTAGANGSNGYSVLNGIVAPTTQGVNGDFYINTATNLIYGPKTAGVWGSGTSLIGPQGAAGTAGANGSNGYSVLNGIVAPTTQGVNGDFYINTATNLIYGPKTAGVWGSGTSLIGPQGAAGTAGANGSNGYSVLNGTVAPTTQGVNGDFYINTATNLIYGPKTAGAWGSGTSLVGPQGAAGTAGANGSNGYSVLNGTVAPITQGVNGDFYINTATNLIYGPKTAGVWGSGTSLVGPQGAAGTAGANGSNGYSVLNGTVAPTTQGVNGDFYINTATNLIYGPKTAGVWGSGTSLVGPQGAAGTAGTPGTNGSNGYSVLNGTVAPTTQGVNGDFYINTATNLIYGPKTAGAWGSGTSLVGPQGVAGTAGTPGTNGSNGYSVLNGTVAPTTQGVNGDFYINTSINLIYGPKTAGAWGSGTSLVGPQGAAGTAGTPGTNGSNGYSVLNGTVAPTTQGVNGDFYINTATNLIYGPKTAGAWGSGTSLVGPQGVAGTAGTPGTNGSNGYSVLNGTVAPTTQGVNGDFYINTSTNFIYGPKTAGAWGSGTSLVGPQGAAGTAGANGSNGYSVLNGTVPPTTQGVNGDFYINTSTNFIYGPKTAGAWGSGTSLVGPAGTYTAGLGIQILGGVISNTATDQTVTLAQGGATTITGSYPSFTISSTNFTGGTGITLNGSAFDAQTTTALWNANQLQGRAIAATAPTSGQVLSWNGTSWTPTADQGVTSAITSLNALNGSTQTFATGTTGTDFTISSAGTTHTFNLPIASSLNTGKLSSSDWSTFNSKLGTSLTSANIWVGNSSNIATARAMSGDAAISNTGVLTIANNAVNGAKIAMGGDLNGDILYYNGTDYTRLAAGTNGTVLKVAGGIPAWGADNNSGTPGGTTTAIQYNNTNAFAGDSANLAWDYTNKRLGVGISNPLGRVVIKGSATALDTEPLFEVKNKSGQTVFVVYPDSVHFYIKDDLVASNRGGFAVSGRSNAKGPSNMYLKVRPDSTRIYTGDTIAGFGASNIGGSNPGNYLHLTQYNSFIGNFAGLHNDEVGGGVYNSFIGYQSGFTNTWGYENTFIGYKAGYSNINGQNNTFIGKQTGYLNTGGSGNIFIGSYAGQNNTASSNVFIGASCGMANVNGNGNVFLGNTSGRDNIAGSSNLFLGSNAGQKNTSGSQNVYMGWSAGGNNILGWNNIFIGHQAGVQCANTAGTGNNLFIGYRSGYSEITGTGNIFIGNQSGYSETGTNKLYIANSNTATPLIYGDFTPATSYVKINGYIAKTAGAVVVSAGTITPTGMVFHVSGANQITTINLPYVGFTGNITIIPDGAFSTNVAGNIAVATNAVVSRAIIFTYDGTKWYPSY